MPTRGAAGAEVGDESVSQILGGEVVQRCTGHRSCDRSDVMSLIIDFASPTFC